MKQVVVMNGLLIGLSVQIFIEPCQGLGMGFTHQEKCLSFQGVSSSPWKTYYKNCLLKGLMIITKPL